MQYNIGLLGENFAKQYLESINLKIISMRYKTKLGEVDIISANEKDKIIIFCEIKSTNSKAIDFENIINRKQWKRIIRAAEYFFIDENFANYHSFDRQFDSIFISNNKIIQHNKNIIIDDFIDDNNF